MISGEEILMGQRADELVSQLPRRVSDKINSWIRNSPTATALQEEKRTWNYAQLGQAISAAREHLEKHGVRPGDRIMLIAENCCALVAFMLAASELDAWVAIINARLSAREIDEIQRDCEPRHLIYTVECSPEALKHATRNNAIFEQHPLLGELAYSATLDAAAEPVFAQAKDQVYAMIYTSGTTGKPKGVMLTHRNIAFIATISGALRGLAATDRVYAVLPISHVFGLASTCMGTLFAGGCLYLAPRFDTQLCLQTLTAKGITVLQGVPPMFSALVESFKISGVPPENLSLRYMSCGGAPLDPQTKAVTEGFFGLALNNGYGMTESSPTITQTRIDEPLQSCATGRPIPGVEICLMDKTGHPVSTGDAGELWVRGPNVMKGYFRQPEQTAQVLNAQGWLNTQDIAQLDASGNLSIIGRTKEMIVRSGFNVYPAEVEAVLNAHPSVTQSAVIGQAHNGDENVLAFVQPLPGTDLTVEELQSYCKQQLTAYKRPSSITLMESLPATATGKILKSRLLDFATDLNRTNNTDTINLR